LYYDDAYRWYLVTRSNSSGDYRFGRTHGKRFRVHTRSAFRRVRGCWKSVIDAIANTKLRRMERELELRGIRYDRPDIKLVDAQPQRAARSRQSK
jgi:hypothetical protein